MKMEIQRECVKMFHSIHDRFFNSVHGNRLIYNTCWEDPRIDRRLLELKTDSEVVMITSAGCNVLDYLFDYPAKIHAVDVNFRQNALLQLKMALISRGCFEDFHEMFADGGHPEYKDVYDSVKSYLPIYARKYWNKKIGYFQKNGVKKTFYYNGAAGDAAWFFKTFILDTQKSLRFNVSKLFEADTLDKQKEVYTGIEPFLLSGLGSWLIKQPALMAMLGVPRPQMNLVNGGYPGGLLGFVRDKLRYVFTEIPIHDNYFWYVYVNGRYDSSFMPNYLKPDNFDIIRNQVDKINLYTCTMTEFLKRNPGRYTHFVLLDHQDWLAWYYPEVLYEEWEYIIKNSIPGTKILMRSAGASVDFIPPFARDVLTFFPEITEKRHREDRVGTYGSVHLAEVRS